jgi:hypothetical protein
MQNFKTALKNAQKIAYHKGLLVGERTAKKQNAEENRFFYIKGACDAFRKFVDRTVLPDNGLRDRTVLPDNGLRKIQKTLNLQLDDFLHSYYDVTDYGHENATDVYANFQNYCQKNDIQPLPSKTMFGKALSIKLFKSKYNGLNFYYGITRKNQPSAGNSLAVVAGDPPGDPAEQQAEFSRTGAPDNGLR